MRAARVKELEEMVAKLLETARKLPQGAGSPQRASGDREISCADSWSATDRIAVGSPKAEGEGEMTMRVLLLLAAISFSATAFAQRAPPKGGNKPLAQVKPHEPTGCTPVGTDNGTTLCAGHCAASEL